MKKNICIKLFTFSFIFLLSALSVFANEINSLKRIIIQPANNNEYNLNFLFDTAYKGKAFIQKSNDNSYYIFLPESEFSKSINYTYKNIGDKKNIQLEAETKPIIKNNIPTKYIRINVFMNDDYKIKLTSGLNSDYHPVIIALKKLGIYSAFLLILLSVTGLILFRIIKNASFNTESNSYTSFPVKFNSYSDLDLNKTSNTNNSKIQRVLIPKNNVKNYIPKDENKFNCFNIESTKKPNNLAYEIKSNLNETTNLLNDKSNTVKLKHTNPITKTSKTEESELLIPVVDEVLTPVQNIENEKASNKTDILSVLKITPNKGFYLISEENTFKLFGFVNKQIYLLESFNDLSQINLQARYYDISGKNEIYIVRLDSYKAMIEISDTSMKELAKI